MADLAKKMVEVSPGAMKRLDDCTDEDAERVIRLKQAGRRLYMELAALGQEVIDRGLSVPVDLTRRVTASEASMNPLVLLAIRDELRAIVRQADGA